MKRSDYRFLCYGICIGAILLACTPMLYAQSSESQPDHFVGGLASFHLAARTDRSPVNTSSFSISGYWGRAYSERWSGGLETSYQASTYTASRLVTTSGISTFVTYITTTSHYHIGVFGRRSFAPNKPLNPFLQPGFYVVRTSERAKNAPIVNENYDDYGFSANIGLGVGYRLNNRLRLLGHLGSVYMSGILPKDGRDGSFSTGLDFSTRSVRFGVEFLF